MLQTVDRITSSWDGYCDRNWLNDDGDVFSPEMRVKRLLDSLGYYLLYGATDGIVTEYKQTVTKAREIPVSSCPSYVNNIMYGSGASKGDAQAEENLSFKVMTEMLDEKAATRKKPKPTKGRQVSRRRKLELIRQENGGAQVERFTVDTDGCFWVGNDVKQVVDLPEYSAKTVHHRNGSEDELYDMDQILRCGHRWYTANGDPIDESHILQAGGILDYDAFESICTEEAVQEERP